MYDNKRHSIKAQLDRSSYSACNINCSTAYVYFFIAANSVIFHPSPRSEKCAIHLRLRVRKSQKEQLRRGKFPVQLIKFCVVYNKYMKV